MSTTFSTARWAALPCSTNPPRHAHQHTAGTGPVYQGRFKSFPVQQNAHYYTLCRYVERNALRADLVRRAEQWRWSSLWHRVKATQVAWLSEGPLPFPEDWSRYVNGVETEAELKALRRSVLRGAPFGDKTWQEQTAAALGLQSALRRQGRPSKMPTTKNLPTNSPLTGLIERPPIKRFDINLRGVDGPIILLRMLAKLSWQL